MLKVARRELRRIVADRYYYLWLLVALPAASYWV